MAKRSLSILAFSMLLVVCSSRQETRTGPGTGNGPGSTSAAGSTGSAGSTGTTGTGAGGSIIVPGDAALADGSSVSRDAACVRDARQGEQVPLDLYFMVDKTGSMNCRTGPEGANCPAP